MDPKRAVCCGYFGASGEASFYEYEGGGFIRRACTVLYGGFCHATQRPQILDFNVNPVAERTVKKLLEQRTSKPGLALH